MTAHSPIRTGGCACGAVRFTTYGPAKRAGLCHCMTCRKAHAAAFDPFVVFDARQAEFEGEMRPWESSPGYRRWFCPACGSRLCGENGDEIEVSVGSFDAPGEFATEYESWIIRRESWLAPLQVPQFESERKA